MEEKQRYEYFFGTNTVKDNINKEFLSYKRVIDTLNQQDKRIKELENKNKQLKHQLAITEKALELCERHHIRFEESTVKEQIDWRETRIKENIEYFKTKAKEMLDNESK